MRNEMRRAVLEIVTFIHIHFFASLHQITVEVIVVRTKESHTIKAVCIPLYCGIALIMQASPIIIRREEMNSVTSSFHIPFMASFISASVNFLSPWWIFIHIFPNRGPCHTAPRAKLITVERIIIVQLSHCIEKMVKNKNWSLVRELKFWIIDETEEIVPRVFQSGYHDIPTDIHGFFYFFRATC